MGDLISRKKLLSRTIYNPLHPPYITEQDVLDCPSAQPEQRWIPRSERLPVERTNPNTRDFEYVLCSTTFGDVRAYKFGAVYGWSKPHFWNGVEIMDEYVLAWMPLPEPYEEDKQND